MSYQGNKYLMLINELFTQPLKWKWDEKRHDFCQASFNIQGMEYFVYFSYDPFEDTPPWFVEFILMGNRSERRLPGFGITNTGNSTLVFATVIEIIKVFMREHPKQTLEFTAKEKSRQNLYTALVKKLSKGYTITPTGTGDLVYTVI